MPLLSAGEALGDMELTIEDLMMELVEAGGRAVLGAAGGGIAGAEAAGGALRAASCAARSARSTTPIARAYPGSFPR